MSSDRGEDRPRLSLSALAGLIATTAAATVAAAWAFEWVGYVPCELCLKERIPYYAGIPLAILVAAVAIRRRDGFLPAGFSALALIFAAGAILGGYHAGVEWQFWPGPASCTGGFAAPAKVDDFLHQLQTASVVRCDAAAVHIIGLSLAAWDAVVCLLLAVVAVWGAERAFRGAR